MGWEGIPPRQSYHFLDVTIFRDGSTGFLPSPLPFRWLHMRWAGCTLLLSSGSPPRLTGTISSTSKLIGWRLTFPSFGSVQVVSE